MNLAEAESELLERVARLQADREPSRIGHHGSSCCRVAYAWLRGVDGSWHRGRTHDSPPAWITERWKWGATKWPIHWCDIPGADALDCGALAAVCRALWSSRCHGIVPVQLIQRYAAHDTIHWAATWKRDKVEAGWIDEDLAYHEIVGRERDGRLQLWDSTDTAWLSPTAPGSYGCALSLRAGTSGAGEIRWATHHLLAGRWTSLAYRNTPA